MKIAVFVLVGIAFAGCIFLFSFGQQLQKPIAAASLQEHLERYVNAGHHRSGGKGDAASRDWLTKELHEAGFDVELQSVPINQWQHESAFLKADGLRMDGFPLWWPPKDATLRNVSGRLRLMADAKHGDIGVMSVDPYLLSSLKAEQRQIIAEGAQRGLSGAIILTKTITGEPFSFNAEDDFAGMAVLVLGSKYADAIDQLISSRIPARLSLQGTYELVETWNVIGRFERAGTKTVVVSTPRTGWFNSGAERGPGISLFIELAHWAVQEGQSDLVFVATGGHEIAHIGMDAFLKEAAPAPDKTENWVHLGASIAAHDWRNPDERLQGKSTAQNTATRWIIFSENQGINIYRRFRSLGYQFSPARVSAFGETADIHAAGYNRFFGFAGGHPYFHLPSDDAENTSGEMLAPVALAIQNIMLESL